MGKRRKNWLEKAFKDKGNITRLINSLEKSNIVVRIPNHVDGRSRLIYLTKRGIDCQNALIPIVQKTLKEAQKKIPKEEMKLCKSVLKKVINNIKK